MRNRALFSSKDKSKKLKCRLLQFLFGALRVNTIDYGFLSHTYFKVPSYIKEKVWNHFFVFFAYKLLQSQTNGISK